MGETKLLKPEEYSSFRKEAMKEIEANILKMEENKMANGKEVKKKIKEPAITYKITCSICKKQKGASKDRYEKLLEKYMSVENMNKTYECRECRKKK